MFEDLGGRPPHTPTIEERHCVRALAGNGANIKVIARLLRISKNTLHKHYKTELASAREEVIAALGTVVVNAALNGDVRGPELAVALRRSGVTQDRVPRAHRRSRPADQGPGDYRGR